jgi:uncharacterized protein YjbJ (UPF0337 family)
MSNLKKRGAGAARELGGKIEKTVGKAVGSERLEAKGRSDELEGQAEQESAKRNERVKGAVEEVTGKIQKKVGDLVDDDETMIKGKARELKGKARQNANR